MLTVHKWRLFIWKFVTGTFLQISIIFVVSVLISFFNKEYDWQNAFVTLSQNSHYGISQIGKGLITVLGAIVICGIYLELCLFALNLWLRITFGTLICVLLYLRFKLIYLSLSLPNLYHSSFKNLTLYSFYWLLIFGVVLNFFKILRRLIEQNEKIKNNNYAFDIDKSERESRLLSLQAIAILLSVAGIVFSLSSLSPSLNYSIGESHTPLTRPNIFIFAIDKLSASELFPSEVKKSQMPRIFNRSKSADYLGSMLIGIPELLPSWSEISSCKYAMKNNIRTRFPMHKEKLDKSDAHTLFSAARSAGYSTALLADSSGSLLSQFNFGVSELFVPPSHLRGKIENIFANNFPILESFLTLPHMQRLLPSLRAMPQLASPNLLAYSFSEIVNKYNSSEAPVFITTQFSRKLDSIRHGSSLDEIDIEIEKILGKLEKSGWLSNSIVLVFGSQGEDSENKLKQIISEKLTSVPLIIWINGRASENILPFSGSRLVRTIDIAPTISKHANFEFFHAECDGAPLLALIDEPPGFSTFAAYQESAEWEHVDSSDNQNIRYGLQQNNYYTDFEGNGDFYLKPNLNATIVNAKQRAWITDKYRLVYFPTVNGPEWMLFDREKDPVGKVNLIDLKSGEANYKVIANELERQLTSFLDEQGIEILKHKNGNNFFVEHVEK